MAEQFLKAQHAMDNTNLRPRPLSLLVLQDKQSDTTDGGIFLPDQAQEKLLSGIVIKTGGSRKSTHGDFNIPQLYSVGQRVYFVQYGLTTLKDKDGVELLHMDQDVVVACCTPEECNAADGDRDQDRPEIDSEL